MAKAFGKTALWLAMAAVAVNGHLYAQGAVEAPLVETYQDADATAQPVFSVQQVEQMVAPVALYPDSLLAQVLMAATYPIEVAQAHQWLQKNRGLTDQALDDAVAAQPWDPSVKTLVFFPEVLERMAQDLAWTQDLGDAFLSQEADVMGAVQRLRRHAQDAGNLASNAQQVVRTQGSTIVVEPADPTVVYVPTYNPATVYGSSWAPATTYYPTTYSYGSSLPTWVVFGAGALVGALLVAAIDWADDDDYYYRPYRRRVHHRHIHYYGPVYWSSEWVGPRYGRPAWRTYQPVYLSRGDVYIDKSKTINVTNQYNTFPKREWNHDPAHRRSVSYRDPEVARRFLDGDGGRRVDRDGVKLPDGGGAQRLDRETIRRLDRSQPAALPSDKATREALQGDPRERRERILRGQPDGRPIGFGAESSEDPALRRLPGRDPERRGPSGADLSRPEGAMRQLERRGGPEAESGALARPEAAAKAPSPRQWQRRAEPESSPEVFERPAMQRRTDPRQLQEAGPGRVPSAVEPQDAQRPAQGQWSRRGEARPFDQRAEPGEASPRLEPRRVPQAAERQEAERQLQQRVEPRQFQQRVEPRSTPQVVAPQETQRRMESRQFQQRVEPRPTPQVVSPQETPRVEPRQFQQRMEPRPTPQVVAPQETQRRMESRQFQQRAESRQMAPPTVQRGQEGVARPVSPPRSAPQSQEAPRQKSGGQAVEQRLRKRDDAGN